MIIMMTVVMEELTKENLWTIANVQTRRTNKTLNVHVYIYKKVKTITGNKREMSHMVQSNRKDGSY
jgi:hypothetical protein